MKIIYITEENHAACVQLFIRVFNGEPWNDSWTDKAAATLFHEYFGMPGFIGYVAIEGDEILAVCLGYIRTWWDGKSYFIEEFFVDNRSQHGGIGTSLLEYIEKDLIKRKVEKMTLLTLRDSNAERFYKKNGYDNRDFLTFMRKKL